MKTRSVVCPRCHHGDFVDDPTAEQTEIRCIQCDLLLLEYAPNDGTFPERTRLWYKRPPRTRG